MVFPAETPAADPEVAPAARPQRVSAYPWFALALLIVTYLFAYIDRQVLGILAQPVKAELHISDTALGFLGGSTFALFYATLGLPLARLSDHFPRRGVVSLALALWSVMTTLTALVGNFWQLLALRIGVAVGEAGCNPGAHSLIADYFPVRQRATAMALYGLGIPFGIGLGMLIGGYAAQHYGWRAAFLALGAPGLLFALVLRLGMREPVRGASDTHRTGGEIDEHIPVRRLLSYLLSLRSFVHMVAGISLQAVAMTGGAMWNPAFLMRSHGLTVGAVGLTLGLLQCLAGGAGSLAGGVLADRLQRYGAARQLSVPVFACLLACPLALGAYVTSEARIALVLIAATVFLQNVQYGTTTSLFSRLSPLRGRGLISGRSLFATNFVSTLLGVQGVGILSDLLRPRFGDESLRCSLMAAAGVFFLWAAGHYVLAARDIARDLDPIEGGAARTELTEGGR